MLESINNLPINQHAKKLLYDQYSGPTQNQIHAVDLLRMFLEDGKLEYWKWTRDVDLLEDAVVDILLLIWHDPVEVAKILRLNEMGGWEPTADELVDELLANIDEARLEKQI